MEYHLEETQPILLVNALLNGREAVVLDDEYEIAFGDGD